MDGTGLSARLGPGSHGALATLLRTPTVCVSSGCSNRVPQLGGLKRQKCCTSRFSRPAAWSQRRRLWILGARGPESACCQAKLSGSPVGELSWLWQLLGSLRAAPSWPLPSQARPSGLAALLRYDLALTNRVCKGSVSSSAHVRRSWGLGLQPIFSGEGQNSTHVDHVHTRPCPAWLTGGGP